MGLPKNGDSVIDQCFNCENEFESQQKLGSWIKCPEEDGGCGFEFKLSAKAGKLETNE